MDQIKTAEFKDETIAVGDKLMPWMLFKSHGQVKVARNIEWAGKDAPGRFIRPRQEGLEDHTTSSSPSRCGNIALRTSHPTHPAGGLQPGRRPGPGQRQ